MYFVPVLKSMFVSRLFTFLLGTLMHLQFTWRGPEGRIRHPFCPSPVGRNVPGAHTVALLLKALRRVQWRHLTLDEQSIPKKSSCDIKSKNLLENKVVFDGIEVAY